MKDFDDEVIEVKQEKTQAEKNGEYESKSSLAGRILFQLFVYAMLIMISHAMLYRELKLEEFEKQWLIGFGSVLLNLLTLLAGYHIGRKSKGD